MTSLSFHPEIRVNRRMETNHAGVFAAGDCAETWHRILEQNTYLPLGTTSHKQGRISNQILLGEIGRELLGLHQTVAARAAQFPIVPAPVRPAAFRNEGGPSRRR